MGIGTNIGWTDHTWNPWQGCTQVSTGCDNCYMAREKRHYRQNPWVVVKSSVATFNLPLSKRVKAGDKVFVCSWSDFCHAAADPLRAAAWQVMRQRPDVIFQICTKRPERLAHCLPADWGSRGWPNVWLGVTGEDQPNYERRVQFLLSTPAAVRFVSIEPMLGAVDASRVLLKYPYGAMVFGKLPARPHLNPLTGYIDNGLPTRIDWVIVGGETGGTMARPMHPLWVSRVRDQCQEAGVAYFYKGAGTGTLPKSHPNYHLLDGREWHQFPEAR